MSSTMKDVIGLQKKFQSLIDEVMDNFDFHKVHKVMKCLNWSWAFSNGVPEIYELKEEARRLLNECLYDVIQHAEDTWSIATGGFKVRATNYKDAEVESDDDFHLALSLSFEVEDWDAY